ncbi:MAG: hypothetical protein JWP87_4826 [Labilithrix sp.]|nr:hypothetical protein [Labilithrix sp.]
MRTSLSAALTFALISLVIACGAPEKEGQYPKRPEGCDVKVFPESPTMPTDNIGPVNATCGDDISNVDCLRTLEDQACKLGADVVWGVADVPSMSNGKKRLAGRAAHTKTAGTTK